MRRINNIKRPNVSVETSFTMYEVPNHSWLGFIATTSHLEDSGLEIPRFDVLFFFHVTLKEDYTIGFMFKEGVRVIEFELIAKDERSHQRHIK